MSEEEEKIITTSFCPFILHHGWEHCVVSTVASMTTK